MNSFKKGTNHGFPIQQSGLTAKRHQTNKSSPTQLSVMLCQPDRFPLRGQRLIVTWPKESCPPPLLTRVFTNNPNTVDVTYKAYYLLAEDPDVGKDTLFSLFLIWRGGGIHFMPTFRRAGWSHVVGRMWPSGRTLGSAADYSNLMV